MIVQALYGETGRGVVRVEFEMAGGYIKKAAVRAALIAVAANRAIATSDLLEAGRLEYREMGRVI